MNIKFLTIPLLLLAVATGAFAQGDGALAPFFVPEFLNAAGTGPAALGFVCTFQAGTTTPLTTYADSARSTPNHNPIQLNAAGRPVVWGGSSLISIYLAPQVYKFNVYAAGTGSTCNGTSVGALIRSVDNVYDWGQLIQAGLLTSLSVGGPFTATDGTFSGALAVKTINGVPQCGRFPGATADAQIAACIGFLPSTGGMADASGIQAAQTWSADPFAGVTKPVTLILGAATFNTTANVTIPANVMVRFAAASIIQVNAGKTLTINGGIDAPSGRLTQLFAADLSGAGNSGGTVLIPSTRVNTIYPQWWGALCNDATHDDRAAIQGAITAANGKPVELPNNATCYLLSKGYAPYALEVSHNNLAIGCSGCTLQDNFADSGSQAVFGTTGLTPYASLTSYAMADSTAGVQSVTLTVAGNAANFAVGDAVWLEQASGDNEINEVVTANAGTGVLVLRWATTKSFVAGSVANAQSNTFRNLSFAGIRFKSHVAGWGISQVIGLKIDGCQWAPLAVLNPMPPPFSLNAIRRLTVNGMVANFPLPVGFGGVLQLGTASVDATISNNDWTAASGINTSLLSVSEYSAKVTVFNNKFAGNCQVTADNAWDADIYNNEISCNADGFGNPYVLFFNVGGGHSANFNVHNNRVISYGANSYAVVGGTPGFHFTDNIVTSLGTTTYAISEGGDGSMVSGNTITSANGGILLSGPDHRSIISGNVVSGSGGPSPAQAIAVADNGTVTQGPQIKNNVIKKFATGVFITALAKEPGIEISGNGVSESTLNYSPATIDLYTATQGYGPSFTPTYTNGTNVTGTSNTGASWSREGNAVTELGTVDVTITGAGDSKFTANLPVASTFTDARDLFGTCSTGVAATPCLVYAVVSGGIQFEFWSPDANSKTIKFALRYIVH